MRLILVRHAKAASGEPDELRPLTPEGREAAQALGVELGAFGPEAVVSSPLVRARETAAPIAAAAGVELAVEQRLSPGASLSDIRAAVAGRGETVVVVGHQPDLSTAVYELTGAEVPFKPGAFAEVAL
ncbi:MAG TPA: histidine phosphatase family protein [Gaiellaceae bacterium]|nr:histidine phosphatase family protein [Gaiellaceae bacterium]